MTIHNQKAKDFHDNLLNKLVTWLDSIGAQVRLPNEAEEAQHDFDNDDHGFDFMVGNTIFDLKGFPLLFINNTASWDSEWWFGKSPARPGLVNDFYVFPYGSHPSEWRVMSRGATRASHKGYGPYCLAQDVLTMGLLAGRCS